MVAMPRKTTGTKDPLGAALAHLDAAVKAGDAAVAKTLRKGATAAALAKLEHTVGALPDELRAWFAWHDGQSGHASIGPRDNDRLVSSAEAADAWKFLEEEGNGPWKAAWLPVMTNGAGDYVVYDCGNGRLVRYYHDDEARPAAAKSLAAWASATAASWERSIASTQPAPPPDGWTRVESPTKNALAKKPAGTAYFFRATSNIGKGIYVHLFWKRAKNEWFQATNSTLEKAWTSISNNLFPFQALRDGGAANYLAEEDVFRDGADAPHAGLYEQRFAKPPFPTKK